MVSRTLSLVWLCRLGWSESATIQECSLWGTVYNLGSQRPPATLGDLSALKGCIDLGRVNTTDCSLGSVCHNFTVAIPNYPDKPVETMHQKHLKKCAPTFRAA